MENQNSENINEEVTTAPVNEEKDLGDKTIDAVENIMITKDHSKEFNKEDVEKNKTNAILCYLPAIPFYFVITGKYKLSNYLRFHASQGITLTIFWIISIFVASLLETLFRRNNYLANDIPFFISIIVYSLYALCFLLSFFGIINTVNDSSKELPLLGKIKIIK